MPEIGSILIWSSEQKQQILIDCRCVERMASSSCHATARENTNSAEI